VVFGSGEPTGLVSTLPGVLTQLRWVLGPDAPILLGFARGGAYPSAFTACRDVGAGWVTYRRVPLVASAATPAQATIWRAGLQVQVMLADESVQIKGYGLVRQLTLFENDAPVLQVLTSDTTATPAGLLYWLRARWRIENMFSYAGGSTTASTRWLTTGWISAPTPGWSPTRPGPRPARPWPPPRPSSPPQKGRYPNCWPGRGPQRRRTPPCQEHTNGSRPLLPHWKAPRRRSAPCPAKVLATDLDPGAKRARPHLARRGLQMVLRLLAFNAEAWLAEHLNAYLTDPNEYRAILRNLLHLSGHVDYTTKAITITLDRPHSPRVARALHLLTEELNATPATMPADHRPLTYQLADA